MTFVPGQGRRHIGLCIGIFKTAYINLGLRYEALRTMAQHHIPEFMPGQGRDPDGQPASKKQHLSEDISPEKQTDFLYNVGTR